jgi:hypothetical protein
MIISILAARLNQRPAQLAIYAVAIGQVDPGQTSLNEILNRQLTNYTLTPESRNLTHPMNYPLTSSMSLMLNGFHYPGI